MDSTCSVEQRARTVYYFRVDVCHGEPVMVVVFGSDVCFSRCVISMFSTERSRRSDFLELLCSFMICFLSGMLPNV